jgi:N-acetyl-S-(2-succino)cysteine monooxygenase
VVRRSESEHNDACDGFLAVPTHFPRGTEDFVSKVVPELQRRGIFRKEYTGKHLRDHLGVEKQN